jgi:ankyrin repeat protein
MNLIQKYKQNSLNKQLLAAAHKDISLIEYLLQKGADINIVDAKGNTLLDLANFEKNITFFLGHGLAFSNTDKLNQALLYCVDAPDTLSKLIAMGGDVNFIHGSFFPLALSYQNKDSLALLLEANADVNKKDSYGNTALHYAINKENIDVVRLLLKHHARSDIKDNQGETPVDLALRLEENTNKACFVEMLGAIILHENFVLPAKGTTYKLARSHCKESWDSKTLSKLIGLGANVNHWDPYDGALLHHATHPRSESNLIVLLKAKANVDAQHPIHNNTALHLAVLNENSYGIRLLLKYQANPDIKNHAGETPVDLALHLYQETKKKCYHEMLAYFNVDVPVPKTEVTAVRTDITFIDKKPELGLSITRIFNFSSGICDVIVYNEKTKIQSNVMTPFEQLEGTKLLTDAETEFRKQGGIPAYSFKKHLNKG